MPIDAYLNVDDVKKSKFYGSARKKPKRRRSNNNSNGHVGIHSTDKSSQELSQIIEKNNGAKTEYEALTMDVIRDGRMARMVCDCGADISIGPNAPRIFEGHLRSCGHCPICGGTSVKIYISITVTKELKLLEWLDGTWG
ncbi:MAG: hypothetical protein AMS21_01120 [Gemmatimonas sp. SG8_38_2]|nr:MAG: hypothetical protein AMS21_01120 [Gemmatimonas sp. SG8_38_2]